VLDESDLVTRELAGDEREPYLRRSGFGGCQASRSTREQT